MAIAAFNPKVVVVIVGGFQKNNVDQHLWPGLIQVRDYLANVMAGLLVGDNNQASRFRIARDNRFADSPISVIIARARCADTGARAAGSPSSVCTAKLLGVLRNRQNEYSEEKKKGDPRWVSNNHGLFSVLLIISSAWWLESQNLCRDWQSRSGSC